MNSKTLKILGYCLGLISMFLFVISYLNTSLLLFFAGAFTLVISILSIIIIMTFDLFQKDKKIDYEAVKKNNLTLIDCQYCGKVNILEDKYCTKCGEKLKNENSEL